jgi:peptidyl-prolyl cis-trans isomerase C
MLKFPAFTRVFALSGLVAGAVVVAVAQQPPSPPSPASPAPPKAAAGTGGTLTPAPPAPPPAPAVAPASTLAPDAVVLTIGGQKITRAQFEELLAAVAPKAATLAAKRQIAEKYSELETMALEARKRMLDQTAEAKQMIALQTDTVLANALAKKLQSNSQFTDLDLRAYYNAHMDEFQEAKGSHILIRFKGSSVPLKPNEKDLTEAEALAKAQDIRSKIIAGADFATLAKAESDDAGSGAKGGDLGAAFKHGQMVPPFDHAAFTLPIGEVSEPVKTNFGYHLIKVTSRTSKTFDEAKSEIEKDLAREEMDKIKNQMPVTLNEEYFGK